MKKVIFECVGNSILFILAGLMLIRPLSTYHLDIDGSQFMIGGTPGIFPALFAVYVIVFLAVRFFIFRDGKKSQYKDSELTYADEREKIIVAEAAKAAYQTVVFGLIVSMALLAGAQAFSLTVLHDAPLSLYAVGVALVTLNLVLAMVSYCVKWCAAYRK